MESRIEFVLKPVSGMALERGVLRSTTALLSCGLGQSHS